MVKIIESSYAREKQVRSIFLQISVDNMSPVFQQNFLSIVKTWVRDFEFVSVKKLGRRLVAISRCKVS